MKARDYPERARDAIKEMYRQVGDLVLDANGLAKVSFGCILINMVQRFCRIFLLGSKGKMTIQSLKTRKNNKQIDQLVCLRRGASS